VSVSRPVRRPVQCRCAISIPGVSAGANNSDNISSSGCAGRSVGARPVRLSVQPRCANVPKRAELYIKGLETVISKDCIGLMRRVESSRRRAYVV